MEEVVDADIAEADAEDDDEAAVEVDEAGDMRKEFDLVKVATWLGKGLVVDAHVVEREDADKDGRGDGLVHSDRNCDRGAGPVEQPLYCDDEDVAAPERQGFFAFSRTRCSFP